MGPTYLEYMYFQEPDQVDQVRIKHRLLLTEDPLQVLHENPIVGDLLPNTMDSHPGRSGTINRHSTIKSFGYLYCDRLRKMVETMTLEEWFGTIGWDLSQNNHGYDISDSSITSGIDSNWWKSI
jgi:hypothetical protein